MAHEYWHDEVLSHCEHVETPRSWLWWSLVTAISAVSANYSLRALKGAVLYKPNLYTMLLGESGLGKGFGVNLSKLLVQAADVTRVIAGRSSIQAIVSELSKAKTRPDKEPIMDSRGFIVNGELSSAIISDVDSLAVLTDLYDGHYNPEWNNLLKITGKEVIKKPYIVALFGSSLAHFYDSIPQANIDGGYIARNLLIYEEKRYQDVDLLDVSTNGDPLVPVYRDVINEYVVPEYSKYLSWISGKNDKIEYTRSAGILLNEWRRDWRKNQPKEKTGFFNRVPDHAVKTAMCICLSRYNTDFVINDFEMQEAINHVSDLIYANKVASVSSSLKMTNDNAARTCKVILDLLVEAPDNQLKRKILLSRAFPYGCADVSVLDNALDTLLQMGYVSKERILAGRETDMLIKLAGEPLGEYLKWKANHGGQMT